MTCYYLNVHFQGQMVNNTLYVHRMSFFFFCNINDGLHTVEKYMSEQDRQWTYNVILRRVRVIAVAVGKK